MIQKFSLYEYEVMPYESEEVKDGFVYIIYHPDYKGKVVLRESDEWYDSEGRARLAAIGHISLLENGEG